MSCRGVRAWLHRDAVSLDEAQRLVLDDHLVGCAACRGDRERLRLVREVGTTLPVPPAGAREYTRAIARALLEGAPRVEPARRRPAWLVPLALGAACAAASALVLFARSDDAPPTPTAVAPAPRPPPATDVVEDGELVTDAGTLHTGDAISPDVVLRAATPTRIRVASLQVAIAPDAELRWSAKDRTLLLDHGRVEIEASGELARVVTERFEIELANAAVTVGPEAVRVRRGTVRVSDRSRKLLAQLEAGSDWQPAEETIEMPSDPIVRTPHPTSKSPAELLADARAQFGAGHFAEAERIAETLLARSHARAEQAEARMFLADLAQATGNLALAVTRYEAVATTFAELPAAESALYAAARLEHRRGRDDAARTLFDRYLERYPNGRYVDDVRRHRRSPP